MPEVMKVLGQDEPAPTTLTDLYTVPGATQTVISTIVICNQNTAPIRFRISIAIGGAADDPSQYLYYDLLLTERNTFAATFGITLAATDVVRIQSDTANVSFNLFGSEVA